MSQGPPDPPRPGHGAAEGLEAAGGTRAILAAFDSWVGNMAQKHGLPAERIPGPGARRHRHSHVGLTRIGHVSTRGG
jgi:hypothetical protein